MSDIVTPQKRSAMMSGIRSRDTKPELLVRKGLHKRGFRYKLHDKSLPGKPDIVLPKYHCVIFIHGCFWHKHQCHLFKWPSSRTEFWRSKIENNKQYDLAVVNQLLLQGWRILIVWECATKGTMKWPVDKLLDEISCWVTQGSPSREIGGT